MAPAYKLSYFDIRGLAECSRILFALGDVKYEDHRCEPALEASPRPGTVRTEAQCGQKRCVGRSAVRTDALCGKRSTLHSCAPPRRAAAPCLRSLRAAQSYGWLSCVPAALGSAASQLPQRGQLSFADCTPLTSPPSSYPFSITAEGKYVTGHVDDKAAGVLALNLVRSYPCAGLTVLCCRRARPPSC